MAAPALFTKPTPRKLQPRSGQVRQLATVAGHADALRLLQSIGCETGRSQKLVRQPTCQSQTEGLSISHDDQCLHGPT